MTRLSDTAIDLLRLLAQMPFLDRLEMAALTGMSRGGVYEAAARLEDAGLIDSVPHATPLLAPTRRYYLPDLFVWTRPETYSPTECFTVSWFGRPR